jgi:predicted esterase
MTNQPLHHRKTDEQRCRQTESPSPASFYADLCALSGLQQAYAHIQENSGELGIDPLDLEAIEATGVEAFLKQLSDDLQARTYTPPQAAESEGHITVCDMVVQVALKRLLESVFPPAFPNDPETEKTIKWLVGNIEKGLYRVYAVNVNESQDSGGHQRLLERASQRIGDPQLIDSLRAILGESTQPGQPAQELLVPLLADIAFEGIDQILQQAKALGREDNFLHVQCTRVGNELVVLSDRDPRYTWIVPAVQKRLREELSRLHYDPASLETQSLDLTCGEPLRFLDYELRWVRRRHGEASVQYRLLERANHRQADNATARLRLLERYHPLRFLEPCLKWLDRWRSWRFLHGVYRKASAIQVSWRHLPITLYPVVALLFGWRSPAAWLDLALICVCNWRSSWDFMRSMSVGERRHKLENAYRKVNSIQVGWRHLPITLFPVLLLLFGWRSPVPWLDLALIFACSWRWTLGIVRWTGRHKLDMVMGACAIAAFVFLSPLLRDIYTHCPREVAASSSLPPGFYKGEYHGPSWWTGEPVPVVHYGLYVPPHLQGKKGPFPLIVFLHGYGERWKTHIFKAGLPQAIAQRFGTNKPNGHFQFIAFFPIDPSGRWEAGSVEVERVMMALDYVIAHHRIDPSRVYLTGHSAGGSGVWSLAEAYPDKWAAVVPLCSFISPDVQKVKHIPAWIFHGAKDQLAPVDRERYLVQQLQEAGADVRYTEVPNRGHYIWDVAYNPKELYKWLASKKKTE